MIVDGKAIATMIYERIQARVAARAHAPRLAIITCAPNFETQKYLALKEKRATQVGIETSVIELPASANTETFLEAIDAVAHTSEGIVVQLPLPPAVDTDAVLRRIPVTHDVDALNPETTAVFSPVVGAIRAILMHHDVPVEGKIVTVIGNGKLVGMPAYHWFTLMGASVSVVTKDTIDVPYYTKQADIIVCGAGVPGLLTPEMVKDGVVILDGGTSEDGGELRGDADPRCAEKAALFTPVPGGIGPVTVAVLLENLVVLSGD